MEDYIPDSEAVEFLTELALALEDKGYTALRLCHSGAAVDMNLLGNNAYELFAMATDSVLSEGTPLSWRCCNISAGQMIEIKLAYGDQHPIDVGYEAGPKSDELNISDIVGRIRSES